MRVKIHHKESKNKNVQKNKNNRHLLFQCSRVCCTALLACACSCCTSRNICSADHTTSSAISTTRRLKPLDLLFQRLEVFVFFLDLLLQDLDLLQQCAIVCCTALLACSCSCSTDQRSGRLSVVLGYVFL